MGRLQGNIIREKRGLCRTHCVAHIHSYFSVVQLVFQQIFGTFQKECFRLFEMIYPY